MGHQNHPCVPRRAAFTCSSRGDPCAGVRIVDSVYDVVKHRGLCAVGVLNNERFVCADGIRTVVHRDQCGFRFCNPRHGGDGHGVWSVRSFDLLFAMSIIDRSHEARN